jgi:hypothetical protein
VLRIRGNTAEEKMKQILDRKTLDSALDTLDRARDGIGDAWRQLGMVEFRKPWIQRKSMASRVGSRPWLSGIVIFSSVLAGVAAILYLRKRKQVANRYNMGETDEARDLSREENVDGVAAGMQREETFRSP